MLSRVQLSFIPRMPSRGLAYRKHPRLKDNRPIVQKYRDIQVGHEKKAAEAGLDWRIVGAT
jgi:hypothetical protein